MVQRPFRRVVVTGVECAGKTTLSRELASALGWAWVPEHARTHEDVLNGQVTEGTFDDLHASQTSAAAAAQQTHKGVICDTGDLVLRMWSEAVLDFSWHPLSSLTHGSICTSSVPRLKRGRKTLFAPFQRSRIDLPLKKNTAPIWRIDTISWPKATRPKRG